MEVNLLQAHHDILINNTLLYNMSMLEPENMNPNDLLFDGFEEERNRGVISGLIVSAKGGNLTGLVILSIIISAVILVFLACYLMLRFMHRALSGGDGKGGADGSSPYSNVVMHSKRVYEIQAEEGCFNGAGGPNEEENSSGAAEDVSSLAADDDSLESDCSRNGSLRKPETGDLRTIRVEGAMEEDPKMMMRKKEKKVHKDSVCAFLFKPQPVPKMV